MNWKPCPAPQADDVVRWTEPLWAAPTKKRGKPDSIGQQRVTAKIVVLSETVTLLVEEVEILSFDTETEPPPKIKSGDTILRKKASLHRGECEKRV